MVMIITRVGKFDKVKLEIARSLVQEFLITTDSIKGEYPDIVKKLSSSPDTIREVFRHSLCVALGLPSISYMREFSGVYPLYANRMKPFLHNVVDKSTEYKQSILQSGVHCIMHITKRSKKELEENYVKY